MTTPSAQAANGSATAGRGPGDDIDALDSVTLSPRQLNCVNLILNGTLAPLEGFMTRADREGVENDCRLDNGAPFPAPLSLSIDTSRAARTRAGTRIALRDGEGLAVAVLDCDDVWPERNGSILLGGKIRSVAPIFQPFFASLRPAPGALRQRLQRLGYERIIAADTGQIINRNDHAHILDVAESLSAAILLNPAIGVPNAEDRDQARLIKSHLAALGHFPADRTELAVLAADFEYAGPREILLHALMRRNLGATHFTSKAADIEAMHTDPAAAVFLDAIGIGMVPWPKRVFLPASGRFVGLPEVGAGEETLTDDQLLSAPVELLRGLERVTFPEVGAVLEDYASEKPHPGLTIFFTGLSGSGKSTIAKIVVAQLAEQTAQPITLFDGDIVRRKFSADLGFSKTDRDTNIRRIGAAAAEITAAGGITVCCAIAPYEETRHAVREMIEAHGTMIEVYIDTPLEVCERRDPKGLYKKARKGLIEHFTGVDDPYEDPVDPELRVHTVEETPAESAGKVLSFLASSGLSGLNGVVTDQAR